jgi:hypothetical protein
MSVAMAGTSLAAFGTLSAAGLGVPVSFGTIGGVLGAGFVVTGGGDAGGGTGRPLSAGFSQETRSAAMHVDAMSESVRDMFTSWYCARGVDCLAFGIVE